MLSNLLPNARRFVTSFEAALTLVNAVFISVDSWLHFLGCGQQDGRQTVERPVFESSTSSGGRAAQGAS
jgi:hypothetical protein